MRWRLSALPWVLAFVAAAALHGAWLVRGLERPARVEVLTLPMPSPPAVVIVTSAAPPAYVNPRWCLRGGVSFASRAALLEALGGADPGVREVLFGAGGLAPGDALRAVGGRTVAHYDDLVQALQAEVPSRDELVVEIERDGVICSRLIRLD